MTNSIDPQQAQRVWSRVMAAGCAAKPAAQAASEAPVQPAQAAATSPQEPAVPLRAQLSLQGYQLMVIQYIQSLTHAQIPVQPEL